MDSQQALFDGLITSAQQAEREGELDVAVSAWQLVRSRFPGRSVGFLSGAACLKKLGRPSEAEAILAEARSQFPDEEWVAVEHAWVVYELGDLATAGKLWRGVRQSFPSNLHGYMGGGLTARRTGDFDEADDIYRVALIRYPTNAEPFIDYAWCAEERRDIPEAIGRWDTVRARFPDMSFGYVRSAALLRQSGRSLEADAINQEALKRFPDDASVATAYAAAAHQQGDWAEALRRWESVVLKFGHFAEGRCGAAQALTELSRYAEAAQVLSPALRMFPDDPRVAIVNGWLAMRRRDVEEAIKIWQDIHARFPDYPETIRGYALALREVGRADDADALILEGTLRFPDDALTATDFARIAENRQDWKEAMTRWQALLARFPDLAAAYIGLGNSLFGAGQIADANAVFQAGLKRLPDEIGIAAAEAQAFERLKNWAGALECWRKVQDRFPGNPIGFVGLGRALRICGELERSIELLHRSLQRFPQNLELEIQLALALGATGEWPKAVALWEDLRQRYPRGQLLATRAYQMMEEARHDQPELFNSPLGSIADAAPEDGDNKALATLLKRFESLGDDCEFGLVQRIFHAGALGLLRWARTLPENLIKALDARFDGVGDPENTIISIVGNEYMTEDRRYSMIGHTFTPPSAITFEEFSVEQCRRMQWLRRKLIDDLTAGRKIFVYKTERVTDAEILAVYEALQRYSTNITLLFVRLQDNEHEAGTVRRVIGNLFVGYMDRFSTIDISISIWARLCQTVANEPAELVEQQAAPL